MCTDVFVRSVMLVTTCTVMMYVCTKLCVMYVCVLKHDTSIKLTIGPEHENLTFFWLRNIGARSKLY
jgi:hypothetical protein